MAATRQLRVINGWPEQAGAGMRNGGGDILMSVLMGA